MLVLVVIMVGGVYLYARPISDIQPTSQIPIQPKTQSIALPWPSTGQAALGAKNYGVLASNNVDDAVPIASIAKVIAAMAVLQQKPLAAGAQGPMITLDSKDLDFYNYYYLNDGSAAKVALGEQISEYQALQAMLIPSANNLADSLTRWAFGSDTAYAAYANQMLKSMGLTNTAVAGASGFADDATSTASDLVTIGIAAIG
ncbi:hypothetical protein KW803_03780 [Candidatus Saccharibacteria bacterium]|nr:hypothetical protein [Candidatus Saccharibacteria bacterium]